MKPVTCLVLMVCEGTLMGAGSSIGIVRSAGDFQVDGSTIRGNSTVFEGNLIETSAVRSIVQIGGTQITLGSNSRAKVYSDHTVLQSGVELMRNGEKRMIEAVIPKMTLKITSADKDGVVMVAMGGPNTVNVFATSGVAEVRNSSGFLLASLNAGMQMAFAPQAGAAASTQMKGVLESSNGRFFLTDTTNKARMELRGPDLAKFVGKSVQVTGSTIPGAAAAGGASQVIQVTKIEQLSQQAAKAAGLPGGAAAGGVAAAGGAAAGAAGGAAAGAAAAGAAAAGVGAAAGIGTAAVVGIGAAVAAGGTLGGLIATGTLSTP